MSDDFSIADEVGRWAVAHPDVFDQLFGVPPAERDWAAIEARVDADLHFTDRGIEDDWVPFGLGMAWVDIKREEARHVE